ncbi:DMT family transporter [candidate division KSB1 bacterium]|nr:DMT family transporter [candidate division KSB1 bacterium]
MNYIGEIAALTGAFFWGICAIMFETAGKRIGTYATNLIRIILACLFLCFTLFLTTGQFFPVDASRNNFLWLGISGIIGLVIGDGALFKSLVILGSRRATLILSLAPPITVVIAWFFLGEKLGLLAIAGIIITVWGIFWVVNEKNVSEATNGSKLKGIIYGLIGALGQAVGLVFAKQGLSDDILPLAATILRMAPSALVLGVMGLVSGNGTRIINALKNNRALLATLGGAIFGPFLGVWLSVVAVKHTETGIASTLLATVPILILPMVIIVHKTRPSFRAVVGSFIAVFGIALLFLR